MKKRRLIFLCLFLSFFLVGYTIYSLVSEGNVEKPVYVQNANLIGVKFLNDKAYYPLNHKFDGLEKLNIGKPYKPFNDGESYYDYVFDHEVNVGEEYIPDGKFSLKVYKANTYYYFTKFIAPTDFNRAYYKQDLDFRSSKFKRLEFYDCTVAGNFNFSDSYVDESAIFVNSNFSQEANFDYTIFKDITYFEKDTFKSNVSFLGTQFNNLLNLRNLNLGGDTKFYFDGCSLPDTLDFSFNGKIYNDIDLTTANFNIPARYYKDSIKLYQPHYINLFRSDVSKFHLDYTHFKLMKSYRYKPGSALTDIPYDDMCGIYEGLLIGFRNRGQQESIKPLDIEYKEYKWQNSKTPWMSEVERRWWNYGYDRNLIFKWTVVFMLLFTLLTFLFLPYLNKTYALEKLGDIGSTEFKTMTLKSLFIRWWYAFVYTAAIFFSLTLKVENIELKRFWGSVYIVTMYTLGIVCLAYMANIIIQK